MRPQLTLQSCSAWARVSRSFGRSPSRISKSVRQQLMQKNPEPQGLPVSIPSRRRNLTAKVVRRNYSLGGHPVLFPAHDGVAYGVSANRNPKDNSTLYLWADNRTTQSVRILTCCAMTLFEHIYVFDSLGQCVPSKMDHRLSTGEQMVRVCTCSSAFSIPPHTIQLV
jgi:hypothetical protein